MMIEKNDTFGKALLDYHQYPGDQQLITWTSLTDEDPVPISYFFRTFNQMPLLEQEAMEIAHGKVLDIGCGAGPHSLFLQNERNFSVTGLDNSPSAVKVASERGLFYTIQQSIFDFHQDNYDTILLLMNGLGICGNLVRLQLLLKKLKSLLHPKGQVLLDSSDLIYLFDETPEGEKIIPANHYYGELEYGLRYKNINQTFPWLYIDYGLLSYIASNIGFETKMIIEGENCDYLARLTREH